MEKIVRDYFVDLFRDNFSTYKNKKIALYGIGDKTDVILENFKEYNFVGVLAEKKEGTYCGVPIISQEDLVTKGVDVVIIVARNHNVPVIMERIKESCVPYGIEVFSIAGVSIRDYGIGGWNEDYEALMPVDDDWMRYIANSKYRSILERPLNSFDIKMLQLFAKKTLNKQRIAGKVVVDNLYDFSYAFLAPMVTSFIFFIIKELRTEKYDKVLFAARDGFLPHKLYRIAKEKYQLNDLPEDIYFQASRMACIAAATQTEQDFEFINTLPCAYNAKYMTQYRWGIPSEELDEYDEKKYPTTLDYLLAHKEAVFKASEQLRQNYHTYMRKVNIADGSRCAFVDLVSGGTCQKMLSQMTDISFEGIYMGKYKAHIESGKKILPIKALYEKKDIGESNDWQPTYLFDKYWFMETVLTSYEPSLHYFDQTGNPVLCDEKRTVRDLVALKELQAGITDFYHDYLELVGDEIPDIHNYVGDLLYRYSGVGCTEVQIPYFETHVLYEDLGLGALPINIAYKDVFRQKFEGQKNARIALYGKGLIAREIIENSDDFNIVGVYDRIVQSGEFLSKKVLVLDELEKDNIEVIVVAAKRENLFTIYKRIYEKVKRAGIKLYNVWGDDLFEQYGEPTDNFQNENCFMDCKQRIKEAIACHDVISFDIFDTLIMRKVYEPQDVFMLVQKEAEERKLGVDKFFENRKLAEQNILLTIPTLDEIYIEFRKLTGASVETCELLKTMEVAVERNVIIPRKEMVEVLNYAAGIGKEIYLITDMYLPTDIIESILWEHGIKGYIKIFNSSDYHKPKVDGLFAEFLKEVKSRSYLHIGDNMVADGTSPLKMGMESYVIEKASSICELSFLYEWKNGAGTWAEYLLYGQYVSHLFNNPFCVDRQTKKIVMEKETERELYQLIKSAQGQDVNSNFLEILASILGVDDRVKKC